LFTLCLENNENKRFLIGFQQRGKPPAEGGPVWDLFKDGFGEIENVDVILIPDLGPNEPAEREMAPLSFARNGTPISAPTE
jgi:hypothetical protein